jgi:hypothetical protein
MSGIHIVVPLSWEMTYKRHNASMVGLRKGNATTTWIQADTIAGMRNEGIKRTRREGGKKVLFVDADMTFDIDALERLLSHDVPIVGGLCRQRREPFSATLWRREGKGHFMVPPEGHGLQEYDATGGAFLLVDMSVFDGIDKQVNVEGRYFVDQRDNVALPKEERCSEDIYFCNLVRHCGFPLYVDLSCKIGHLVIGEVIDGDDHEPQFRLEKGAQ